MKLLFKYVFFLQLASYCLVGQGQDVQQQFLSPHNDARAQVGVEALVWDDTVAAYAQNYPNQRIGDSALQHSGGQYGEDIFEEMGLPTLWYWLVQGQNVQQQGQDVKQQFLSPHNDARAQVGVEALVWDDTVASYAQNYANQRIGDCALQHSGGQYGENLFEEMGEADPVGGAVASWVNEQLYYDYSSNSCAEGQVCGHYTQVVWRDSKRLGCAQAQCNNGWTFVICDYDPPGNYVGQKPY